MATPIIFIFLLAVINELIMRITFTAFLLVLPALVFGQSTQKVTELQDKNVIQALSSVTSFTVRDFGKGVARIYTIDNGSGSANVPETDESSQSILICVSAYDEHPKYRIFSVNTLINPKVISSGAPNSNTLVIEEGNASSRKQHTITLYEDRITYN